MLMMRIEAEEKQDLTNTTAFHSLQALDHIFRPRAQRNMPVQRSRDSELMMQRRKQTYYCYMLGMFLIIFTPDYDCNEKNLHFLTEKSWIIGFGIISCIQMAKENFSDKVDQMFNEDRITYR